jgi:hypothetical protein
MKSIKKNSRNFNGLYYATHEYNQATQSPQPLENMEKLNEWEQQIFIVINIGIKMINVSLQTIAQQRVDKQQTSPSILILTIDLLSAVGIKGFQNNLH